MADETRWGDTHPAPERRAALRLVAGDAAHQDSEERTATTAPQSAPSDSPVADPLRPKVPVIAILRAPSAERFAEVAAVLQESGITAVEFTLNSAGALDALRECAGFAHPVGAGTVLTAADAARAVAAGAAYLITPAVIEEVIAEGRRLGVPVLSGALTPTEIHRAWTLGSSMVKVFPAAVGGPDYIKAVRAPLPDIPLVPTGGVGLREARAYLDAGAAALGIGSPLLGDACAGGDLDALRERALVLRDQLS
ncbi:bifunctional 4-hydroxy-2-oxoglutarate aldolase/2-dehydro-3-deoxy-phosphogluconate aldolase [Nocardia sp. CDC160]|uniref:bifunctional 4-hydroxy-2-oxoglutarate aldolase/2-dehydro-3-deoxy-phosphogluconate aldolase n=1 Tax=Nocardia sp. CDC160 TaxID=3112166 RepID=UPI002DB6A03E|nr:bifunctional 4-hydroxy-2-oxoglutarate aldolase/2-dehydro-3-deoxy-phosphogluconate aldolase [Nocardia sp. CDC160]MEC3915900.1 bifunctional 4-hydroxy-2-oxoglutarate aldolase/2-dehydro-3-deoxy-phosphogluconate aldolase [Nocardia sp. CDC160]